MTTHRETQLRAKLRQQIDSGLAMSRDPGNAALPELSARTTTIYSPWYVRTCRRCKDKFREGDRVRLCPLCQDAYHDDDQFRLHCWQEQFADGGVCRKARYDPIAEAYDDGCPYHWSGRFPDQPPRAGDEFQPRRRIAQVTAQFLSGLERVWMPYGREPVFEVEDDSPVEGCYCPWCRFQIRAGDRVVKCPCGKCYGHFHDDIYRHLICWNDWNGSQGNDHCPITGETIEKKIPPSKAESNSGS
jgi:hypothetical protein